MPNMNLGKKARHTASITNRTSIFGIMGGTIQSGNYRNSIRSAIYRATTLNKIPPRPTPGKEYMLAHNLLSINPQCSGGVGRMHTHPGACGPCDCGALRIEIPSAPANYTFCTGGKDCSSPVKHCKTSSNYPCCCESPEDYNAPPDGSWCKQQGAPQCTWPPTSKGGGSCYHCKGDIATKGASWHQKINFTSSLQKMRLGESINGL